MGRGYKNEHSMSPNLAQKGKLSPKQQTVDYIWRTHLVHAKRILIFGDKLFVINTILGLTLVISKQVTH